jgi:hypothetical protein
MTAGSVTERPQNEADDADDEQRDRTPPLDVVHTL